MNAFPVWLNNPVHVITDLTNDISYRPFDYPDVVYPYSLYKKEMDGSINMKIKSVDSCTYDG